MTTTKNRAIIEARDTATVLLAQEVVRIERAIEEIEAEPRAAERLAELRRARTEIREEIVRIGAEGVEGVEWPADLRGHLTFTGTWRSAGFAPGAKFGEFPADDDAENVVFPVMPGEEPSLFDEAEARFRARLAVAVTGRRWLIEAGISPATAKAKIGVYLTAEEADFLVGALAVASFSDRSTAELTEDGKRRAVDLMMRLKRIAP